MHPCGTADRTAPALAAPRAEVAPPLSEDVLVRVLAGLIERKHGLAAICGFLALDENALYDAVVRFGLPTPVDRQLLRRSGPKAWSVADVGRLIVSWTADTPVRLMGDRLNRTPGAIYCKSRSLGLPKRDRRLVLANTRCVGVVDAQSGGKTKVLSVRSASGENILVPMIATRGQIDWSRELDLELSNRYLANQHYSVIAAEWGVSPSTIASRANRLELPARDRAKLVPHYDPSVIEANIAEARYVRRECRFLSGWYFWSQKNGPRTSKRGEKIRTRSGGGYGLGISYGVAVSGISFAL